MRRGELPLTPSLPSLAVTEAGLLNAPVGSPISVARYGQSCQLK